MPISKKEEEAEGEKHEKQEENHLPNLIDYHKLSDILISSYQKLKSVDLTMKL